MGKWIVAKVDASIHGLIGNLTATQEIISNVKSVFLWQYS